MIVFMSFRFGRFDIDLIIIDLNKRQKSIFQARGTHTQNAYSVVEGKKLSKIYDRQSSFIYSSKQKRTIHSMEIEGV